MKLYNFCDSTGRNADRIQPGDVVVLVSGARLIVGDINEVGGVCDDCTHEHYMGEVAEIIRADKRTAGLQLSETLRHVSIRDKVWVVETGIYYESPHRILSVHVDYGKAVAAALAAQSEAVIDWKLDKGIADRWDHAGYEWIGVSEHEVQL